MAKKAFSIYILLFRILTFNSIFLQTDTGETFMESLLNGLQQHYTQFESQNTNSTSSTITSMYPECYVVLMCDLYPHVSQNLAKNYFYVNIIFYLKKKKKFLVKIGFFDKLLLQLCSTISYAKHTCEWHHERGKTEINSFQKEEG